MRYNQKTLIKYLNHKVKKSALNAKQILGFVIFHCKICLLKLLQKIASLYYDHAFS